ncbi:MAG: hypothetical protein WC455_26790 [Dehalococcoidia bacterium]|jgi:hypothetical protein
MILQFTQVKNEHELKDIGKLETTEDYERITRVVKPLPQSSAKYSVWIDRMSEDGSSLLGDPITVSPDQALYLLKDFFKMPKKMYGRLLNIN